MENLLDFLKVFLPGGLVLYGMYLTVRALIGREQKQWIAKIHEEGVKISLPLRLQAYERLCLFLERSALSNLMLRADSTARSARDFQECLLRMLREEFSHNFSQQIYVSEETWHHIKSAVEETNLLVNQAADHLPSEATKQVLARKIVELLQQQKYDPIYHALSFLKTEARQLL